MIKDKKNEPMSNWIDMKVVSIEKFNRCVDILNKLEEKEIIQLLHIDVSIISYIKEPSEKISSCILNNYPTYYKELKKQYKNHDIKFLKTYKEMWPIKNQTVDLCLFALKQRKDNFKYVRIVPNPDFKTTLANLKKKKVILEALND